MKTGGVSSSANAPKNQIPPAHWTSYPVTGGKATLTRSFQAHTSIDTFDDVMYSRAASWDGYIVSIHAQPYNFRLGPYTDNTGTAHPTGVGKDNNGQLHFHYVWNSTDGKLADLTSCVVYEHISLAGNSTGSYSIDPSGTAVYAPPNPPFGYTLVSIYDQPDPAKPNPTSGTVGDIDDIQVRGAIVTPYVAASYTSTQDWQFNDSDTKQNRVELLGPITVTRNVSGSSTTPWVYTVSKSGSSNPYPLP